MNLSKNCSITISCCTERIPCSRNSLASSKRSSLQIKNTTYEQIAGYKFGTARTGLYLEIHWPFVLVICSDKENELREGHNLFPPGVKPSALLVMYVALCDPFYGFFNRAVVKRYVIPNISGEQLDWTIIAWIAIMVEVIWTWQRTITRVSLFFLHCMVCLNTIWLERDNTKTGIVDEKHVWIRCTTNQRSESPKPSTQVSNQVLLHPVVEFTFSCGLLVPVTAFLVVIPPIGADISTIFSPRMMRVSIGPTVIMASMVGLVMSFRTTIVLTVCTTVVATTTSLPITFTTDRGRIIVTFSFCSSFSIPIMKNAHHPKRSRISNHFKTKTFHGNQILRTIF